MNKKKENLTYEVMEDDKIISLYWARDEQAITETDKKYKRYLYSIAYNILHDAMDCDECLNDTYLGTWNAIPPARPHVFQAFLSKIMRNTATVRYKRNTADKRIPSEMTISLEELDQCIPHGLTVEEEYTITELGRVLSKYLRELSDNDAFIFFCRYYCSDKISDIAQMLHINERTVYRKLTAMRQNLKALLEKEGFKYE